MVFKRLSRKVLFSGRPNNYIFCLVGVPREHPKGVPWGKNVMTNVARRPEEIVPRRVQHHPNYHRSDQNLCHLYGIFVAIYSRAVKYHHNHHAGGEPKMLFILWVKQYE